MFQILRAMSLQPLEWEQAVHATGSSAPYVQQVLDAAFARAQAVVVLLSGDDEARLQRQYVCDHDPAFELHLTPQPRPNVLFEAGMALARCPDRTVLLQIGDTRPFSDIAGRHMLRFTGTPETRNALRSRLLAAGCILTDTGSDWLTAGAQYFSAPANATPRLLDLGLDNPKVFD